MYTAKDLSEGFKEFKSVRLIYLEDRRLSRSFNDRASHMNKTDKPNNNNNNVPTSRNHSLSKENTAEQKIHTRQLKQWTQGLPDALLSPSSKIKKHPL